MSDTISHIESNQPAPNDPNTFGPADQAAESAAQAHDTTDWRNFAHHDQRIVEGLPVYSPMDTTKPQIDAPTAAQVMADQAAKTPQTQPNQQS
ncbi:MAG: hypothetical protein ABI221_03005 [Candidatus Saccharimonadales bacterium]